MTLASSSLRSATALLALSLVAPALAGPSVLYVDAGATGAATGLSWADAFPDLGLALAVASGGEVWIAEGTYTPASPGGDRYATFALQSGLAIYGGFAGTETALAQRDPAAHPTILSGDLNGDDQAGFVLHHENSHHVVTALGVDATAILDGVTVQAGTATSASGGASYGAGLRLESADPTLRQVVVRDCLSVLGAGACVLGGSPRFTGCRFVGNQAWQGRGGAMYRTGPGSVVLEDCVFSGNSAVGGAGPTDGGALWNDAPGLLLTRCDFIGNWSDFYCCPSTILPTSGAVANLGDGVEFHECRFVGNRAPVAGALWTGGDVLLRQCLFSGNRATVTATGGGYAGAIFAFTANVDLRNTVVSGNSATESAGGLSIGFNSSATIRNSIVWGNTAGPEQPLVKAQIHKNNGGTASLRYSDVQGLLQTIPGEDPPNPANFPGCIDQDPLFVDANGADDAIGTLDDDCRLAAASPCLDRGENAAVPAGLLADLDGYPRFVDAPAPDLGLGTPPLVDLGVYERGGVAVTSLTADPPALSVSQGGVQRFALAAGGLRAGKTYWIVGSASGTTPGIPVGNGVVLPLGALDAWFNVTIAFANQPPLFGSTAGTLDAAGKAEATFTIPAATTPAVIGLTLHHAAAVLDGMLPVYASNAVPMTFAP